MSESFARSKHRFTVAFAALALLAATGCGGSGSTAAVDPSGNALKGGIPANGQGKSNGHGQGAQAGSASVEHGQGNGHAAAGHGPDDHGPQAGHGQGNGHAAAGHGNATEHGPQAGHGNGNGNGHAHAQAGDDADDQADEM
jgi:hypothetical protein